MHSGTPLKHANDTIFGLTYLNFIKIYYIMENHGYL